MKHVQLGRRMLGSREFSARRFGKLQEPQRRQDIRHFDHRRIECDVSRRKHTRRLRGSHRFAAVVTLVRRVAGHRSAALPALLVLSYGGHAIGERQEQDRDEC